MKYVAIIKATGANYTSLISSLKRLGVEYRLTNKAEVIQKAD
jgi:imidazoleglycerol phosphate synthase glutamine amidotransferase subunit HisH